jgi:hypothetical protein
MMDKSAVEMLSVADHRILGSRASLNVPPILLVEIVADLSKQFPNGTPSPHMVSTFAQRLSWPQMAINEDFASVCAASMQGRNPSDCGGCLPMGMTQVTGADGTAGSFVDQTDLDMMLIRWCRQQFETSELRFASSWRTKAKWLSRDGIDASLRDRNVTIPRVRNTRLALAAANQIMQSTDMGALTNVLDSVFGLCLPRRLKVAAKDALDCWNRAAWYAGHCLRSLLVFRIAEGSELVPQRPSNLIDLEYLFYLPFCTLFVSNDAVHTALAPLLLRDNQAFLVGADLKARLTTEVAEGGTGHLAQPS